MLLSHCSLLNMILQYVVSSSVVRPTTYFYPRFPSLHVIRHLSQDLSPSSLKPSVRIVLKPCWVPKWAVSVCLSACRCLLTTSENSREIYQVEFPLTVFVLTLVIVSIHLFTNSSCYYIFCGTGASVVTGCSSPKTSSNDWNHFYNFMYQDNLKWRLCATSNSPIKFFSALLGECSPIWAIRWFIFFFIMDIVTSFMLNSVSDKSFSKLHHAPKYALAYSAGLWCGNYLCFF